MFRGVHGRYPPSDEEHKNLKYSCFCPICITPNIHNMMQHLQLRVATQV